jgi:serine/threonine-protein kinase
LRRAATATVGAGATGDLARQAREIAGDLDTIVLTALRREPARRYPSAAALGEDLRRWLEGRPIAARADSPGYRLRKFAGRHRLAVASGIAVLLALVAGTGVALWQAGLAREQAALAAVEAARASEQARRATTIKRFFSRMFQDSAPTAQRRGAQFTAREWVEQASARVATELAAAPDAQAEIRVALATALVGFDARNEARPLLEAAIPQLRASAADDPGPLVAGLQYLAIVQRGDGEFEAARATVDEALLLNEQVADREARLESALELRTQLLTQANAQRNYAAALEIGRAILRDRGEQLGADHPRLAVDWNNIGQTHNMLEQPVEAAQALERALALLRADPQSAESRQAFVLAGLCQAALGRGQLALALTQAAQAREVAVRTLGATHMIVHRADSCALVALREAQRYDEATRALAQAARWGTRDKPLYRAHLALAKIASGGRPDNLEETIRELAEAPCGQGYGRFVLGHLAYAAAEWGPAKRYLEAFVRRTAASPPLQAIALAGEVAMSKATLAKMSAN